MGNKQTKGKIREDTDEESNGSGLPSYHTSPSPTSSSESEGDVIEYEASSPSQPRTSGLRPSKSLDLSLNQINRALGSFKIFNSEEYLKLKEQISSEEAKIASRMTDSNKIERKAKEPKKTRGRPKKEAVKTATQTNPDAESVNEAAKPLTRSKRQALVSQQLQQEQQQIDENNKLIQQQSSDQLIASNSRAPTRSFLTIKRIAQLDDEQK